VSFSFFYVLSFYIQLPSNLWIGVLVVILFVVLSILSKKIDVLGGIVGGIISMALFLGGGFIFMGYLFLFFVAGSAVSAFKMKNKIKAGLEEENSGKRSYVNALANGGMAAILGLACWMLPQYALQLHGLLRLTFRYFFHQIVLLFSSKSTLFETKYFHFRHFGGPTIT